MEGIYIVLTVIVGGLISAVVLLAGKNASKSARLKALQAELKKQIMEQERAKKITTSVCIMDEYSVRQRLHAMANKQR